LNGDAILDLLVLSRDGSLDRLSAGSRTRLACRTRLAVVNGLSNLQPGRAVAARRSRQQRRRRRHRRDGGRSAHRARGAEGKYVRDRRPLQLDVRGLADLDGDGRLKRSAWRTVNHPSRTYLAPGTITGRRCAPRATTVTGDQRINSFGIGGEIELRSGLHVAEAGDHVAVVHFGLGEAPRPRSRIGWPNGALQSEFDTPANQVQSRRSASRARVRGCSPGTGARWRS
jgi:hypothetical protein